MTQNLPGDTKIEDLFRNGETYIRIEKQGNQFYKSEIREAQATPIVSPGSVTTAGGQVPILHQPEGLLKPSNIRLDGTMNHSLGLPLNLSPGLENLLSQVKTVHTNSEVCAYVDQVVKEIKNHSNPPQWWPTVLLFMKRANRCDISWRLWLCQNSLTSSAPHMTSFRL